MINTDLLLAWGASYKKLDTGEIIFKEGTQCQYYFQLVSGIVNPILTLSISSPIVRQSLTN